METGTEDQAPPLPAQGNTDIFKGPTVLPLPAPYQGEQAPQPSAGGPLPAQWWLPPAPASAQPWSALPFARAAFAQLPPNVAGPAITQALRLEGLLGFDADRKAGVPVAEAMAKWASKLYADHPSVAAALSKPQPKPFAPSMVDVDGQKMFMTGPNRAQFPPAPPFDANKPVNAQPVMLNGVPMPGYSAVPTKGGVHIINQSEKGVSAAQQQAMTLRATIAELSQLSKAIENADAARDQSTVRALRQRHNEVLNRLHDMTAGAPASAKKKSRPSKGFVESGHRFKDLSGVPANDPRNWEAVE